MFLPSADHFVLSIANKTDLGIQGLKIDDLLLDLKQNNSAELFTQDHVSAHKKLKLGMKTSAIISKLIGSEGHMDVSVESKDKQRAEVRVNLKYCVNV